MDFDDFTTELMTIKKKEGDLYRRVWTYKRGGAFGSPIILHDGTLFTCSNDFFVYGIEPEKGKKVWEFGTDGGLINISPEINNGVIYFGSYDQCIYAVSIESRKLLWKLKTGDKIASGCTYSDGIVYCGSRDSYMYALKSENGEILWRFRTGDIINSKPGILGEKILFGSYDGYLYCLDKTTGQEIWRFKTGGNASFLDDPLIENDIIYFGSQDNFLYAVSIKTGKEIWRFKSGGGNCSVPSIIGNVLLLASRDFNLYALDKISGKEIWRFQSEHGVPTASGFGASRPIITEDSIFIASSAGRVYCLSHDGKKKWEFKAEGSFWVTGLFYKGKVYYGSEDCHLYCIDGKTGEEVWRFSARLLSQEPAEIEDYSPIEVQIDKHEDYEDEVVDEKYGINFNIGMSLDSEYSEKSEYTQKSEYVTKSEYK